MMHSSSSGNHPQVQAAAGRAVVGDPSSAAASAAVHPRARDSGSSEDSPRSTAIRYAGERPANEEENNSGSEAFDEAPLPRATANIDAILPPLASYDAAADDGDATIPPAQIGADHERRDAAIKESIKTPSNAEDAPMHPSQIAAHYGNTEKAIKESIKYANSSGSGTDAPLPPSQIATLVGETEDHEEHGLKKRAVPTTKAEGVTLPPSLTSSNAEDAPMHPSQIAADFGNMFETIKDSIKDANGSGSGMDAPLPPSQMAALVEETEDDEEYDLEKKAAAKTEADRDTLPPSLSAMSQIVEQEETLQQEQDPPTPAVAREPSPPPMDQGQSPEVPVQPPLQSMSSPAEAISDGAARRPSGIMSAAVQWARRQHNSLRARDEDEDPPLSALPRDPSVPVLAGTLAEDEPEIPLYDAVQVTEQTWLKKKKKYIYGGLGLLIGAVTAGVSVGSNNGTSGSNTIESEGIVLSSSPGKSLIPSFQKSISFSPSETPSSSLRPSLLPSSPLSTYWPSLNMASQNIAEILRAHFFLTESGVIEAGLLDALAGDGPFTMFAPNNPGVEALGFEALQSLLAVPDQLAELMKYHLVSGKVMAADIVTGTLPTLNGAEIRVVVDDEGSVRVNDALVLATDIKASNGVIHMIDKIIFPPDDDDGPAPP